MINSFVYMIVGAGYAYHSNNGKKCEQQETSLQYIALDI